jgi:hypothetical protein
VVGLIWEHCQIGRVVVLLVEIDVVDNLAGSEWAL